MQYPFLQSPPKKAPLNLRGAYQERQGKKALSSEEAEKESTNSDSDVDETHVTRSMVESSRIKKVKKFDFVAEHGKHIHLTEEQINQQKKIEEEAKAEAAKRKSGVRKEELVDLLGLEVVNKYYNDKLQYDRYYDKMLNRRAESRITNCDVLTRKGPITLKVYKEDGTSEIIPNFKASDLHLGEWREVTNACPNRTGKGWTTIYEIRTRMDYIHTTEAKLGINLDIPLSELDPLDKLNDHANKKRKHVDDIHDYFKANKRLKSLVQYEDHLAGAVLNEHVLEIFFRRHQGPGLDDHARTFSSFLLAEERDIKSKETSLPINAKRIEELLYLSNKLNRTAEAEAEASVLVIRDFVVHVHNESQSVIIRSTEAINEMKQRSFLKLTMFELCNNLKF
ncbi:hypothetical protein Tco_0117860 [Tanacetum coccineum]